MKHLMTLALAAATLISVQAADSVFRSDINCVKTQNPLEIKSDNMKTGRLTWLKNKADHQYTVTATKTSAMTGRPSATPSPPEKTEISDSPFRDSGRRTKKNAAGF